MNHPIGQVLSSVNRSPAKTRWYHRKRVYEQNIRGGPNSTLTENVQSQSFTYSDPLQVYFDLQIFQELPSNDSAHLLWEPMKGQLQLEANKRRTIRPAEFATEKKAHTCALTAKDFTPRLSGPRLPCYEARRLQFPACRQNRKARCPQRR